MDLNKDPEEFSMQDQIPQLFSGIPLRSQEMFYAATDSPIADTRSFLRNVTRRYRARFVNWQVIAGCRTARSNSLLKFPLDKGAKP